MTEYFLCCHLINDAKVRLAAEECGKRNRTVCAEVGGEIDLAEVYFRNLDRGVRLLHSYGVTAAVIDVAKEFLDEAHAFIRALVWRMTSLTSGSLMRLIYRYIVEAVGRMFINCHAAFMSVFTKCFDPDPAMAEELVQYIDLVDRLKELVPSISYPVDERDARRRESFEEELYS